MNYNAKTILFASLIAGIILSFSMTGFADATQDNEQRLKDKQNRLDLIVKDIDSAMLTIVDLESKIANLASLGPVDFKRLDELRGEIAHNHDKIDDLEAKADILLEIPKNRYAKMMEAKESIIKMYESKGGIIDYVFIDQYEESIQIVLKSDSFEEHKDGVKEDAKAIADQKSTLFNIGDVEIGVNHFIPSAVSSDRICGEINGHTAHCATATIGFPATREYMDSNGQSVTDMGFVTVGHAFREVLSPVAGEPASSGQLRVLEPGPENGNFKAGSITDLEWQGQILGYLSYGIYKKNTIHDSAFVKLDDGKTVEPAVKLWHGNEYPITRYVPTGSQSSTAIVYQSGAYSGLTSGPIADLSPESGNGIHAKYNECGGDSGAPVGRYNESGFELWGIHLGIATETSLDDFDQTAQCAGLDGYSRYMPYDAIHTDIGINGTLQPGTVTGTVFSDTNGNGIKDSGEAGIEGYTMYAIDALTGSSRTATTNYLGEYTFENVRASPNSTLIQTYFFPPGTTVYDPNTSWFKYVSPAPSETVRFDVGFYPVPADEMVTLNITVFADVNGNGDIDHGEGIEGLGGFYVYTYTIGPVAYPVPDARGMATVTDLVPADFGLFVDVSSLAESRYIWSSTTYSRDDTTVGKTFDASVPVADDPEPGSVHTMTLELVPIS